MALIKDESHSQWGFTSMFVKSMQVVWIEPVLTQLFYGKEKNATDKNAINTQSYKESIPRSGTLCRTGSSAHHAYAR